MTSCCCTIDVSANADLITSIEIASFFPRPEEELAWHLHSSTMWGVPMPRRNAVVFRNPSYIRLKVWSNGVPPLAELDVFLRAQPDVWIQCLWRCATGEGGAWIGDHRAGHEPSVKESRWNGPPCDEPLSY